MIRQSNEVLALQQTIRQPNRRPLIWAGAVGLLIYLAFQLIPEVVRLVRDPDAWNYIAESEAEAAAVRFAEEHFGGGFEPAGTLHQIQERLYGYLSREGLGEEYDERFGGRYPLETWLVELIGDDGAVLYVHVHMRTGEIVAWNEVSGGGRELEFGAASLAARAFAIERGYAERVLHLRGLPEDGRVVFDIANESAGEAKLTLRMDIRQEDGGAVRVAAFKPEFELPEEYTRYVDKQESIASIMTLAGYMGLSFVLFIIAVIYAALLRRWTSFARGLLLSGIFLLFYQINNFNMIDGIRASAGETADAGSMTVVLMVVQVVYTLGMAVSVWFAFVGGDGLWRSMGMRKWMRRGEPGFGADVWQAAKIGYCAAFALLGLQALIFLVMERGFGVWSSADVTQSLLNFRWVLLFPLLAWCAAISEEAMYRLFGVGLFRKWFRNTAAASVIPTVIWALGHVAYPIYPWTTRLIELTIIGLLFCWLFVRYGFAAALFAHAIFDLVLMATSLMLLGGADAILAGIFYIVHPLGVAWLIHWWDRRPPKRAVAAHAALAAGAAGAIPMAGAQMPAGQAPAGQAPAGAGADAPDTGEPEASGTGAGAPGSAVPGFAGTESGAPGSSNPGTDTPKPGKPGNNPSGSDKPGISSPDY